MGEAVLWGQSPRDGFDLAASVVVLPVGATEQHGPHLPTGTDAFLAESLAGEAVARAAERTSGDVVLAPCLPFGVSGHHLDFGGTLSLKARTMLLVLEDLLDSLERQGARRLLIVNGHGGNQGVLEAATGSADARSGITVATANYWDLGGFGPPGHAGHFESSLMLAMAGQSTWMSRWKPDGASRPAVPSQLKVHGRWIWQATDGVTADPSLATAQEGQAIRDRVVDGIAQAIVTLAELPL